MIAHPKQDIIDRFFEAYGKHDLDAIREVMAENVTWHYMGRHPLAGIKRGVEEVVAFFDQVGAIMKDSKPKIEKPIIAENMNYLVECVHTTTNREDGINVDHFACVLWRFEGDKIIEGKHFFADPEVVDRYFTALVK